MLSDQDSIQSLLCSVLGITQTTMEKLLDCYDTIPNILQSPVYQLKVIVDEKIAKKIYNVYTLLCTYPAQDVNIGDIYKDPSSIARYYWKRLSTAKKEHVFILLLDAKHRIIKDELLSIGTLDCSFVDPREIFKSALLASTHAIVLIHNHPSGDCSPSKEDIIITKRLSKIGYLMKISVLDHIIIGGNMYYSCIGKTFGNMEE